MLKVAVTGGIGSGKTIVCEVFEKLGIPIFYADIVAKDLLDSNSEIIANLKTLFGDEIYLPDGSINRKKLANIIFNDTFALQKVNGLIHPAVRREFQRWALKQKAPYVIQETAILFESNIADLFDKIITVTAPTELKFERVIKRDNTTREQIISRMDKQITDEEKIAKSDFVIFNDGSRPVVQQILEIHKKLI